MPRSLTKSTLTRALLVLVVLALAGFVVAHHDNEAEHKQAIVDATLSVGSQGAQDLPPTTSSKAPKATNTMATSRTPPADLVIEDEYVPSNSASLKHAAAGDKIRVHYTGTLWTDGSKFDSSRDRNKPFPITLGIGQVIRGWDEGIVGMVVGQKRKLTIPPAKAYGDRGFPPVIPGGATLVFEVELLAFGDQQGRSDL